MYCPSCGASVAQGLNYCNFCGARLGGARGGDAGNASGIRPELLVSAMVGLFILGLVAIAVLLGVLKEVAGLDLPFILIAAIVSFSLMFVVESVLIWLLLRGRRGARAAGDAESPKEQMTRELGDAQPRALPEPTPSVTEHTTRTFDPVYNERK